MKLLRKTDNGFAAVIGGVVALLVSIAVGVLIWYKLSGSLYTQTVSGFGSKGVSAGVNTTWGTINTTANTIWTLFPIVGIVAIAGIILMIVTNFGKGSSGV